MTDKKMITLIAQLKSHNQCKSQNHWRRRRAVKVFRKSAAVPTLTQTVKGMNEDFSTRWDAIRALGAIGDRRAVPVLIQVLNDKHSAMEWIAAEALGEIGDRRAVPALSAVLGDGKADWMRHSYAIEALVKIGDPQAAALALVKTGSPEFPALMKFLGEEDELDARYYAAMLASRGIEGYPDPSLETQSRREVVRALRMIEHPQAVPALIKVLRNKRLNIVVRYGAAKVLIQLKESQVVLDLIDALKDLGIGWLVCSEIVEVSARVGVPAVPILIAALHTKDRVLGRNAATVLAEIAQHHPDPVLRTALPALRRLRNRNPAFGGALEQIEAATGAFKDLLAPAAAPPPDTRILPRPVNTLSDDLMPPPKDWWIRLRRTLRGS